MKISKDTLTVMKSFASINSNLFIKEGNTLATINIANNVMASSDVAETFPQEFGIYDLNEFLSVVGLFAEPDIEFKEKFALIKDKSLSVKFFAADASVLTIPTKKITFPKVDIEFVLSATQLATLVKTAAVVRAPDLSIIGEDGRLYIKVGDLKNLTSNNVEVELGDTKETFNANLRIDNLKLMPQNYTVSISSKKISRFVSEDKRMTVYIALESTSTFE